MIYVDSEGNQKHVKDADAKLVEREKEGIHPGKVMAVTGGSHSGLLCEVLALEPQVSPGALSFLTLRNSLSSQASVMRDMGAVLRAAIRDSHSGELW